MKKILTIMVFLILLVIGGNFLYKKIKEQKLIQQIELCSRAYECVIDKNDKEIQHCKSTTNKGKIVDLDCKSLSVCTKAYRCKTDENNYELANCKINQNDKIDDIVCPNTFCGEAYGCVNDGTNSELLKCRYMDFNRNEENNIKCPKNK